MRVIILLSTLLAITFAGFGDKSRNKNAGADDSYYYPGQDSNYGPYSGGSGQSSYYQDQDSNYGTYSGSYSGGKDQDSNYGPYSGSFSGGKDQSSYYQDQDSNYGPYSGGNGQSSYYQGQDSNYGTYSGSYSGGKDQSSYYPDQNSYYGGSYNNYYSQCPTTTTTYYVQPTSGQDAIDCEFIVLDCASGTASMQLSVPVSGKKRTVLGGGGEWSPPVTLVGTAQYQCNKDGIITIYGYFIYDGFVIVLIQSLYPDGSVSGSLTVCWCKDFDTSKGQCKNTHWSATFTGTSTVVSAGGKYNGHGFGGPGSNSKGGFPKVTDAAQSQVDPQSDSASLDSDSADSQGSGSGPQKSQKPSN